MSEAEEIINCAFCDFLSIDRNVVVEHWKHCRERLKLEKGMEAETGRD